ncbi:hypothetical protein M427DRAFT_47631 [Gonapodya prolifera JEL478]|uniref:Uncharacterized protein n=1 Tax=Gonapodya prolifera (strain JEL478) TaxID=1344416 RepID=A0A139A2G6_GONPJ|nr:hypothetical protein M427DRAFT_47631 [Gonapodya prolifera JEL478]|eukprot:KXS10980.1 hypothetical protein M427DRAFT_47631 [Gonapodya prolifera JEL478]
MADANATQPAATLQPHLDHSNGSAGAPRQTKVNLSRPGVARNVAIGIAECVCSPAPPSLSPRAAADPSRPLPVRRCGSTPRSLGARSPETVQQGAPKVTQTAKKHQCDGLARSGHSNHGAS